MYFTLCACFSNKSLLTKVYILFRHNGCRMWTFEAYVYPLMFANGRIL